MKTLTKALTTVLILITIILFTINPLIAQNGDPPPPPGEHGQNGNQPPGGCAPITGGIGILLALGAAYGGNKLRNTRKNKPVGKHVYPFVSAFESRTVFCITRQC
jgi:hypothetical protein